MNGEQTLFQRLWKFKAHAFSTVFLIISFVLFLPVLIIALSLLDNKSGFDSIPWLIFWVGCSAIIMLFSLIAMILLIVSWIKKKDRKISEYLFLAHLLLFLSPWGLGYGYFYYQDYKRHVQERAHYQSMSLDQQLAYQLQYWNYHYPDQRYGKEKDIERLIREGANIDALDATGFSPLCHAARQGYKPKTVKYILDRGAKLNQQCAEGETAIHIVAKYCHQENMKILAEYASDLTVRSEKHDTPFDLVMKGVERNPNNCVLTALVLQQHGVDIKQQDSNGNTLLHKVAPRASLNVVRLLVEAGFDVNIKNNDGFTARILAVQEYEKNNYSTDHPVHKYLAELENK